MLVYLYKKIIISPVSKLKNMENLPPIPQKCDIELLLNKRDKYKLNVN